MVDDGEVNGGVRECDECLFVECRYLFVRCEFGVVIHVVDAYR